jgi:hypothetical protein
MYNKERRMTYVSDKKTPVTTKYASHMFTQDSCWLQLTDVTGTAIIYRNHKSSKSKVKSSSKDGSVIDDDVATLRNRLKTCEFSDSTRRVYI